MNLSQASGPARVLVVDDSPVFARILADVLDGDPALQVVHRAGDGIEALKWLETGAADVLTLDVQMPRLDGLGTLSEVVRRHRLPCVMVSSTTRDGAATTLEALEKGAVDFFAKPEVDNPAAVLAVAEVLRAKVRAAAQVDMGRLLRGRPELVTPSFLGTPRRDLIALGASTGGPRSLETVLRPFPGDLPLRFVIAQHMPARFTTELARRLDAACRVRVREARDGDRLEPGLALVVPGGLNSRVEGAGDDLVLRFDPGPPAGPFVPSVDRLFSSLAAVGGRRVVACLLTGMGDDGVEGLRKVRERLGATLAESERSSVVFGMPGSAVAAGVVDVVVSKEQMAEEILHKVMV